MEDDLKDVREFLKRNKERIELIVMAIAFIVIIYTCITILQNIHILNSNPCDLCLKQSQFIYEQFGG